MDKLKHTIIKMLKETLPNVTVSDTPFVENITSSTLKLLFKEQIDDNTIKVIDYDKYVDYMLEEVPNIENITEVVINSIKYNVTEYNSEEGILVLDNKVSNLLEYNDVIELEQKLEVKEDFIYYYSPNGYSKTLNGNVVEYYNRQHLDIFIVNDEHNDKVGYYKKTLGKLFNRNFVLYDEESKTKEVAYVVSQLSFSISEYNVSNKILRGSMLIKTYSYE